MIARGVHLVTIKSSFLRIKFYLVVLWLIMLMLSMLIKLKACLSISVNKIQQIQAKINLWVKAFKMMVNRFHDIFFHLISLVNDS